MSHPPACGDCDEPVLWALTPMDKWLPLNPAPDPDGNAAAYRDHTGRWRARILHKDEQPRGYERLFMPHFATCTERQRAGGDTTQATTTDTPRKQA